MRLPYRDCDPQLIKEFVRDGEREEFPTDFPPALKTMIERAWAQVKPPSLQPLSLLFIVWAGRQAAPVHGGLRAGAAAVSGAA